MFYIYVIVHFSMYINVTLVYLKKKLKKTLNLKKFIISFKA